MPASEQYAEINVQPGYQLMCGKKALQYVRYRHTDTDLVRAARQQDFLSAARQRVPIHDLVLGPNELIDIFTEYTTSDISDTETMIEVLKLFIASRNAEINEVDFPAELGPSFVYASPERDRRRGRTVPRDRSERRPARLARRTGSPEGEGQEEEGKKRQAEAKPKPREGEAAGRDGLVPAGEAGEAEAKIVARKVCSGFPVFYPTRLPSGAAYEESNPYLQIQDPRVYHFKDTDDNRHGAYRMVLTLELPDGVHYFGVQGIQGWSDPPILSGPSITKTIHGREYDIFLDGDRVKLIAWHRGDNTYWVANGLLRALTNDQMIGIARSAKV